ncbi:hypothetical protein SAMN05428947_1171 [Mucilaginibacter sp. OK283]|jgi:hypothetical protein|nr:hypothetical protein SAMN05428947_1171 [Mucilaginibacter sp. OK283]
MSLGQLTMFVVKRNALDYFLLRLKYKLPDEMNIRELHSYYLAWRLSISGPQGRSLATA